MIYLLACLVIAASPAPTAFPAGDTPATAIVDPAKNESDGVAWEYRYLRDHPCDGDAYDRLHPLPTTKAERDFFFDITGYFGKY